MDEQFVDRDLVPDFVIVYVAGYPLGGTRIARTHARSFETLDELVTFAEQTKIAAGDLIGVWELGQRLNLSQRVEVKTEVKTVRQWTKPEGR